MRITIGLVLLSGLGCSGSSAVCGAVGSGGQLDIAATGALVVAPDERHVAFLRGAQTIEAGCMHRGAQLTTGTLVVVELQSDGSACQRAVTDSARAQTISFGSDSRGLVFLDDVDDCGFGKLKTAAVDGASVRVVHAGVYSAQVVGATVFFRVKDDNHTFAVPIAGGNAVSLGVLPDSIDFSYAANAIGTALAYPNYEPGDAGAALGSLVMFALPSGKSQTLVDAATEQFGNLTWSARGSWFAFCRGPQGASQLATLTLLAADGSRRIDVSANSACAFTFSPDEAWLAYLEPDAAGGWRVVSFSLAEQSRVAVGVLPEGSDPALAFSDDGAVLLATVDAATSSATSLYAATTATAGSLRLVFDGVGLLSEVASTSGYLAAVTGNTTVGVYPVSGGVPVMLPGFEPAFERGVPAPRLLVRQYKPGGVTIAATDGSAATTYATPDVVEFATWWGFAAVYGTVPSSGGALTISALTNAGAVPILLASEVGQYAWAPVAAPTRLFYSREVANAGGPAGVFYADLAR